MEKSDQVVALFEYIEELEEDEGRVERALVAKQLRKIFEEFVDCDYCGRSTGLTDEKANRCAYETCLQVICKHCATESLLQDDKVCPECEDGEGPLKGKGSRFGENIRPGQVWWRAKDGKKIDAAVLSAHREKESLLIKEEGKQKTISIMDFFFEYEPYDQYKFRNLAITSSRWCVAGGFANSGGIQEWCYDEKDAIKRMEAMNKDPRSFDLSAERDTN